MLAIPSASRQSLIEMSGSFSGLILSALPAIVLLVLPGFALLRICVPARELGFISRLTLAPGVTTALCVLMFAWGKLFGLKFGPVTPWLMIAFAVLSLLVVRRRGTWGLANRISCRRLRRVPLGDWLAGVALVAVLGVLLIVRFNSTRGWMVPPGLDSPHHTVIVQLLLEHHGLFSSWAPYSDAETFTYHFGFHAVTVLFAWMSGSDAVFAISVMVRAMGVCAVAALFGLVRLWTRSSWGGVFAAAVWAVSSWQLYFFDVSGRWTPLAGLAILPSALVLLSLFLRAGGPSTKWRLGLLCVATSAGLVLAQYKTAVIFAVLATFLFCSRCIAAMLDAYPHRPGRIIEISCRAFAIVALTSLLVAPRLSAVMATQTGQHLNRVLFEAPPANAIGVGATTRSVIELVRTGFDRPETAIASSLAVLGAAAILLRRRQALWFAFGWVAIAVLMNPGLLGMSRPALIDHAYWKYAVPTGIAAMAGLAVGLGCEAVNRPRNFAWNSALLLGVLVFTGWSASRQPPLPEDVHFVLPDDVPVMSWIKANVPANERIAGRGFFLQGIVQGQDATLWVPYFTRHLTNQTLLPAALEQAPAAAREKSKSFTAELYVRDMSSPQSALWMEGEGYRWFYSGASPPEVLPVISYRETDRKLLNQLERNPSLELVVTQGAARLYRVR